MEQGLVDFDRQDPMIVQDRVEITHLGNEGFARLVFKMDTVDESFDRVGRCAHHVIGEGCCLVRMLFDPADGSLELFGEHSHDLRILLIKLLFDNHSGIREFAKTGVRLVEQSTVADFTVSHFVLFGNRL